MMIVMPPMSAIEVDAAGADREALAEHARRRGRPRYTPATTMVAAWMSAETGVGPAMASGSQVCSGNWPLLPMMPMSRQAAPTSQSVWSAPRLQRVAR